MITDLKINIEDFMAIGIGPLPPVYQPPAKTKIIPRVERKDPVKKPDNQKDKEEKGT